MLNIKVQIQKLKNSLHDSSKFWSNKKDFCTYRYTVVYIDCTVFLRDLYIYICLVSTTVDANVRFTISTLYSIFMLCWKEEIGREREKERKKRLIPITSSTYGFFFIVSYFFLFCPWRNDASKSTIRPRDQHVLPQRKQFSKRMRINWCRKIMFDRTREGVWNISICDRFFVSHHENHRMLVFSMAVLVIQFNLEETMINLSGWLTLPTIN